MPRSKNKVINFADLPEDIIFYIFAMLSPLDLLRHVQFVSKNIKTLANDDYLWQGLYQAIFKQPAPAIGATPQGLQTTIFNALTWLEQPFRQFSVSPLEVHDQQTRPRAIPVLGCYQKLVRPLLAVADHGEIFESDAVVTVSYLNDKYHFLHADYSSYSSNNCWEGSSSHPQIIICPKDERELLQYAHLLQIPADRIDIIIVLLPGSTVLSEQIDKKTNVEVIDLSKVDSDDAEDLQAAFQRGYEKMLYAISCPLSQQLTGVVIESYDRDFFRLSQ